MPNLPPGRTARQLKNNAAGSAPREISFQDFAILARQRRWSVASLAVRFRGRIENPKEFFARILVGKFPDTVITYRSVLQFFKEFQATGPPEDRKLCACHCGQVVFDNKKWATPGCRTRARRKQVTDQQKSPRQVANFVDSKLRQNRRVAIYPLIAARILKTGL